MGGMMRFGIPKYRLPREVLDAEMQRIVDMGVTVKLNSKVDNILDTMKKGSASMPPSSPSAPTSASAP
jgi:NADPH-dependent glutamate synthase beta subunit-like oxidoreductase